MKKHLKKHPLISLVIAFQISTNSANACIHIGKTACYVLLSPFIGGVESGIAFGAGEVMRPKGQRSDFWLVYGSTTLTFIASALIFGTLEGNFEGFFKEHETIRGIIGATMLFVVPITIGIFSYQRNLEAKTSPDGTNQSLNLSLPRLMF